MTMPTFSAFPSYRAPTLPSADYYDASGSLLSQVEAMQERKAREAEDVDMEAESVKAINSDPAYAQIDSQSLIGEQRYLALDTNVLINHLPLIQEIFAVFSVQDQHPISLLVPQVVVNELDGLKTGDHNLRDESFVFTKATPYRSRVAVKWLLAMIRQRGKTGHGAIRLQIKDERLDTRFRKADDDVLDCAMYFRKAGAGEVTVWSQDNALCLKIEAEGIKTIVAPDPTLADIVDQCGISASALASAQTRRLELEDAASDGGMQIDADLHPAIPLSAHPQSQSTLHLISPGSTSSQTTTLAHPTPSRSISTAHASPSPLPSRTPSSRPPIPTDTLARLTLLANLILTALPAPPSLPPSSTLSRKSTRDAFDGLISALERLEPPSDNRELEILLCLLLANLIDLADWVRPPPPETKKGAQKGQSKQVLNTEAAKALEVVLAVLPQVGMVLEAPEEWRELADLIRNL